MTILPILRVKFHYRSSSSYLSPGSTVADEHTITNEKLDLKDCMHNSYRTQYEAPSHRLQNLMAVTILTLTCHLVITVDSDKSS